MGAPGSPTSPAGQLLFEGTSPGVLVPVSRREVALIEYDAAREALRLAAFFASVIKSGEPWTQTCQREYDRVFGGEG